MFIFLKSKMIRVILSVFLVTVLTSCKNKVKLTGKREEIAFGMSDNYILEKSNQDVKLGFKFISPKECKQSYFSPSNQYDGINTNLKTKKQWSFSFDKHGNNKVPLKTNILVIKNKVFTSDASGKIYAIDIDTGKLIWKTKTSNKDISSGTFLSYNGANSIYVTTAFCELLTIDVYSGKIKSVKQLNAPAKTPVVVNDEKVFVLSSDNKIACYDMRNMESLWEYTGFFENAGIVGLAKPAIANDIIIVPSKSGDVFALNSINGSLIWECSINRSRITDAITFISQIKSSPVIHNGNVYLISNVGKVICVTLNKGEPLWKINDIGSIKTPSISGNAMFVIDNNNSLVAINNNDGKIFWKKNIGNILNYKESLNCFGPIITLDGVNVFVENGECLVFSPHNGRLIRRVKLESDVVDMPLFLNDKMIMVSNRGISCFQ